MTTDVDDYFLPGVSFTVDGETLPAREWSWVMVASCGCTAGAHLVTTDTLSEAAAWKQMSGDARMVKRDRERGFTIRMVKRRDVNFDDCPHTPKWGYKHPPKPEGHSWATTTKLRTLHLVPLTELSREQQKEYHREWDAPPTGRVQSLCERADYYLFEWTRKWYRIDGKVECSHCVKIAEKAS